MMGLIWLQDEKKDDDGFLASIVDNRPHDTVGRKKDRVAPFQ